MFLQQQQQILLTLEKDIDRSYLLHRNGLGLI